VRSALRTVYDFDHNAKEAFVEKLHTYGTILYFPTCQVRTSRFYQIYFLLPSSSFSFLFLFLPLPSFSFRFLPLPSTSLRFLPLFLSFAQTRGIYFDP
jgi:hypothetical protein